MADRPDLLPRQPLADHVLLAVYQCGSKLRVRLGSFRSGYRIRAEYAGLATVPGVRVYCGPVSVHYPPLVSPGAVVMEVSLNPSFEQEHGLAGRITVALR